MATSGAAGSPPSVTEETNRQIDEFLRAAPPPAIDDGQPKGVVSGERKVHGEVGVSVGTGGYRSAYAISAMPVGQTGTLVLAVQDTRFGKYGGPRRFGGYGAEGDLRSAALSLSLGETAAEACGKDPRPRPTFRPYDPGFTPRRCALADVDR